jgi:hypothetical protein
MIIRLLSQIMSMLLDDMFVAVAIGLLLCF